MHNIKLIVSYDGTAYLGWQKTNTGPSIESTLQTALEQILQHPVKLQAASRTDAGVHARGQIVNFLSQKQSLDLNKLVYSLNSILPKDIAILEASCMPIEFHPTLDCKAKEYCYTICNNSIQFPEMRLYSWHYPQALNVEMMKEAATLLCGTQDFKAFCNARKDLDYSDHIRTVSDISIKESNKYLEIRVSGNHFLYKMVRNIVGTLVYIGEERISLKQLSVILNSKDRKEAGVTAPAHGLSLYRVMY